MERLADISPGCNRAIRTLLQVPKQNRLWVTHVHANAVLKPGLISICGLFGVMSGVRIGGATDPFSSCTEKIGSSNAYQIVVEGYHFDLVQIYGQDFIVEPVSVGRGMTGCSFLYHGIALCFACLPTEPQSTEGRSTMSRLKELAPHLRSCFD